MCFISDSHEDQGGLLRETFLFACHALIEAFWLAPRIRMSSFGIRLIILDTCCVKFVASLTC